MIELFNFPPRIQSVMWLHLKRFTVFKLFHSHSHMFLGIYYPKFSIYYLTGNICSREHDANMIPPTWQHPHFGFFLSGGVCGPSVSCLQRIFCGATITVLPRSPTVTHRRMSGREKPTVRGWPGLSHQLESHLTSPDSTWWPGFSRHLITPAADMRAKTLVWFG